MPDISDTCQVASINCLDYNMSVDPIITTKVLDTSKGKVVSQTISYRLGMPQTKYGFLIGEIPWEASSFDRPSSDPSDYNTPFQESKKEADIVYIVQKETTEEGKRKLTRILREEHHLNDTIDFF